MSKKFHRASKFVPLIASMFVPVVARAAAVDRFWGIACTIFDWVYTFAIVVGITYVVISAYKFMSAGGDESAVSEARKTLTYAVVGIAVALVSASVPNIIGSILEVDPGTACP